MKKILFVLLALVFMLGLTGMKVSATFGPIQSGPQWLPWVNPTPCTAPGGCWINDCTTWDLGPVTMVPDSTGVWITFTATIGDFSTGPHAGHITVGEDGFYNNPTYAQVAGDTADPVALFTGTVLDNVANIPATITYNKHVNVSAGHTIAIYFGQEGCANCARVITIPVPPYTPPPPPPAFGQQWLCKDGSSCFNYGVTPGPDKQCLLWDRSGVSTYSSIEALCKVDPSYTGGFVQGKYGWVPLPTNQWMSYQWFFSHINN